MNVALLKDDAALLLRAATAAGKAALGYFQSGSETSAKVSYKEGNSPVSEADLAANDVLEKMLRQARPQYGWVSEETADSEDRLACETLFVVDPIDGTRAFIAGRTEWCVSAAIVHRGYPVAGVIFCPALELTFQATKGLGATRNGITIHCSSQESLAGALCAGPKSVIDLIKTGTQDLRIAPRVPSLAYRLAQAAAGTVDLAIASTGSHDWDIAAADVLLKEAGAVLVDLDGQRLIYNRRSLKRDVLCAGPSTLARKAAHVLANNTPSLAQ